MLTAQEKVRIQQASHDCVLIENYFGPLYPFFCFINAESGEKKITVFILR